MIDEIDLVPLVAEHQRWLAACGRLERAADALPALPNAIEVAALRVELRKLLPGEAAAAGYPLAHLYAREAATPLGARLLARLQCRRAALSVEAADLADMLGADTSSRPSADTIGYMFRSVFATCREVSLLEQLLPLLLAPTRLTASARTLLTERACMPARV
jgi:hypothetical protein